MEAFLSSTAAVAIAEIGDKTQLLALFLVTRYRRPWIITCGVFLATVINHGLSAGLGNWITQWLPTAWLPWLISASFFAVGFWQLIPDKEDEGESAFTQYGPFLATLILFFLAEIGDKTQIATVLLAAKYDATLAVVVGTTFGMLLANVPVIFGGRWLMERIPVKLAHRLAFILFMVLGVITLVGAIFHA